MSPKSVPDRGTQIDDFKNVARELGCDESEAAFDKALGVIGRGKVAGTGKATQEEAVGKAVEMAMRLPLSLRIAAICAAVTCASMLLFALGAQIFNLVGWPQSEASDFIFETLTVVFWLFAVATAVMTLVGFWATRRLFLQIARRARTTPQP